MELTAYEKDMLAGKYGEGTALAMKIQVGIGETFDAARMVPITRAHVALSAQDADLWFVEKLLNKGARCRISPTVNPSIDLAYLNEHLFEIPQEGIDIVTATNEAYRKIGATLTFDCTPFLQQNIPAFGEVVAFSESSATPRPPHPWLELAIEVWRLRCSVFRGTPMAFFCVHSKEQKCYGFPRFSAPASMETVRLPCF